MFVVAFKSKLILEVKEGILEYKNKNSVSLARTFVESTGMSVSLAQTAGFQNII